MANNRIIKTEGNLQVQATPSGKFEVWRLSDSGSFDDKYEAIRFITKPAAVLLNMVEGWHFIDRSLQLTHGDGRKVEAGDTIHVDGPIVVMKNGLLVSTKPIVALKFGRRPIACRVVGSGEVVQGNDGQWACSDRTCLWLSDATFAVIQWAGWCAVRALTNLKERGLPVDPRSDAGAEMALTYGEVVQDANIPMGAMQAAFVMGQPPEVMAGAMAASMVAQAVQAAGRMSSFNFTNQFPIQLPTPFVLPASPFGQPVTTGGPSPFQAPTFTAIGSMDFAITNAEGSTEQAARAFPDYQAEREIQNEDLENRLLQLEPQKASRPL